ncbi:hypothetical protein OC835_002552 [Tilletia horrida]|uniref:DUF1753-domain-containing protein n=1 Tax=Tilletia horrida TaxID=155126 RepID=A0AAN6JIL1_9BASI|nr:hypothetical protein OC842_005239 [Tilletia horrida]KAK0534861.1 hypothetical protein OC835_002552 [Tilletia horrida]KAK0558447.1 hypothetical protein OC844_005151 [Tilletia horrida]
MSRVHFRPSSSGGLARFLPAQLLPTSFLGLLDLKLGASIITLFALFNKVVGVYGIIAVFHGGSLAQISLYVYSLGTIAVLLWGLRGISDEKPSTVLAYANLFTLDHMLSTFWTLLFAFHWFSLPHDGAKPELAPHQAGLMDLIENIEKQYELPGKVEHHVPLGADARKELAQKVWRDERTFATFIYFALVLYSFALHLRHGTYHSLASTKLSGAGSNGSAGAASSSIVGGSESQLRNAPDGSGGPRYHPVNQYSIGTEDDMPWTDSDEDEDDDNIDAEKAKGRSRESNGEVGRGAGGEGRGSEANGSALGRIGR